MLRHMAATVARQARPVDILAGTNRGGPLPVVMEAIATAVAGGLLGGGVGWLAAPWLGIAMGAVGAANGAVSGARRIYRWRRRQGWVAFALDSTWGQVGILGALAIHAANRVRADAEYRPDCSYRQNRHIYVRGFRLRRTYAFTLGNVITNATGGGTRLRPRFLERHETLHIWQSRLFGPLFPTGYVVWGAGGALVAAVVWLFNRKESLADLVTTATYYDNPFEYWAYVNDGHWPHPDANALLRWPRPAEQSPEDAAARRHDRADGCTPPE